MLRLKDIGVKLENVTSPILSLRDFVPADYPALISWFPTPSDLRLFAGTPVDWPLTIAKLAARADARESEAFTAILGDPEIAVGHVEMIRETAEQVRLGRIAIAPSLRGRGLIAQLLECANDRARAAGFRSVSLLVIPENVSALRAYARAGFVDTGPSRAYPDYTRMLLQIQ